MASISARQFNAAQFKSSAASWERMSGVTVKAARGAMVQWAREVSKKIKETISMQTGPFGPSSPEGSPPFKRTGKLYKSIGYKTTGTHTVNKITVLVGSGVSSIAGSGVQTSSGGADPGYAAHVEFGTTRMAPRPYLRPVLEADSFHHTDSVVYKAILAAQNAF